MPNAHALSIPEQGRINPDLTISAIHRQPGTRTGYIGLADALRVIRRRIGVILLVVALAFVAALLFLATTPPTFKATTTVMVLPADQGLSSSVPNMVPTATDDAAIQTKVELLQSRALMKQTAQSLRLADDKEFSPPVQDRSWTDSLFAFLTPDAPAPRDSSDLAEMAERARSEAITDRLIDHISVARIARSNVIAITASSMDPAKAALIANRLVETYIHNQIDEANDSQRRQIKALSKRVAEVRSYLERAELAAAAYRRQHGLLSSQPEGTASNEVSQLSGLRVQAMSDSANDGRRAAAVLPGGAPVATSPLLTDLLQQETMLSRKVAELTTFYGPGYPQLIQAGAELTALRSRIRQESTRIQAELRAQAAASQARTAAVAAAISGLRNRSFGDGQAAVPLRALERNVGAVNAQYSALLNELNAKLGAPADNNPDISRVSRAPMPDAPAYPMPKRVLAIALLAALAIGILLAFIIDTMDTKLRTGEQVRRLLGIPTLAMVPELNAEEGKVHAAVAGRPRSRFAEAMRNLLIELEVRIPANRGRVVVITSPLEGEGKNTVAVSLAAAAAVLGRRAVVVDFDLRRPDPAMNEGNSEGKSAGVVAFLAKRALVDDLVTVEEEGHFAVIGVGETARDPGALIGSPQLPQLISELRDRFELVILNGPPILPVRDAKTLADQADATLLVLRWGRTSPEAAMAAMEIFGGQIAGAVINRVDYEAHAGRRYGDAIHHVSLSTAYYEAEPKRAGSRFRARRWARSLAGRVSESLHLT